MKPEPDELELAVRARNGDREALAELIRRLRVGLFAVAYAELRHYEDAQDAVAAALYRICCHAADLRDPASMRAWMYTVVRNETHRMRRGKQAETVSLESAAELNVEDPSPLLRIDIQRALLRLPNDQAHAVSLFYLRGWSIGEIARYLARPEGTIKYWLHQGRQRLANEMKGYVPMEPTWKACIVAPEIEAIHLQCLTEALKGAGFADVRNIAEVRSLDDLYQMNIAPSVIHNTRGSISVSNEGGYGAEAGSKVETRLVFESEDRTIQVNGLLSDQSIVRLIEPLASCDVLLLGECIAGRSAFEFMTLLRAIVPTLPVCLLLEAPVSDYSVLASWVGGFTKLCILKTPLPAQQLQDFQNCFAGVRANLEPKAMPD